MTGIEPVTSSLPRKHSTPELSRLMPSSEVRISEFRKTKFIFLNSFGGESRIRTCEDVVSGFTVRPRWPLEYLPKPFTFSYLQLSR